MAMVPHQCVVVDTRERIKFVLNTAQKHLSNLKGLVPSMPPDERQSLTDSFEGNHNGTVTSASDSP